MKPSLQRQVAIIEQLAERWPQCFVVLQARRRPLKVGIYDDIVAQLEVALPGVTPDELRRAIGHYVHNPVYRSKLTIGAERIDLDGNAVGAVTEEQAKQSRVQRAQMTAAHKRKLQTQKAQQPIAAPPPPPRPAGDGLAQLREAARRRKEQATKAAETV
jgi:ProP effector